MKPPVQQLDPSVLIEDTVFKLLTAGAEHWARVDLTMPQLKVLLLLGQHRSAPVSWLASRMEVSPPNITGILDRLEQRQWVERTSDPHDRRVVRILLTPEGEKLLHELASAGVTNMRAQIDTLGKSSQESLRDGLAAFLATTESESGEANGLQTNGHRLS